MKISSSQVPEIYLEIITKQNEIASESATVNDVDEIPDTSDIAVKDDAAWIRIPEVICVYIDMVGSTILSASQHERSTATTYQWFTGTAVRLFSAFEAPYVDVRGDGVFALFDGGMPNTALASAVTFKTFVEQEFAPRVEKKTNGKVSTGTHIGIDCKTVLVKKVGLPRRNERTDRQNEVWAGKPVNMASKLCSRCPSGSIFVSDRFFQLLESDLALKSCGCGNSGEKKDLWVEKKLEDDSVFDFNTYYELQSSWCNIHGAEYCEGIVALDA